MIIGHSIKSKLHGLPTPRVETDGRLRKLRTETAQKRNATGSPIEDVLGVARAGEEMRVLEIAQLRSSAQNEIHRHKEQHGEYETREVRAVGN